MFRISDIACDFLHIPFHQQFAHASAAHSKTESIWVKISTDDGITGYGEGCPRLYVTGESLQSAAVFVRLVREEVKQIVRDMDSLQRWVSDNRVLIDTNPAAWCAVELALLDIIAKQNQQTIEELLSISCEQQVFRYTAVLGTGAIETFARQARVYAKLGFRDYKVKLSGVLADDQARLELLHSSQSKDIRIRADANNLWSKGEEVADYLKALPVPLFAIEEPVSKDSYAVMRQIAAQADLAIILDESFQRLAQLESLRQDPARWILNLRVSKLGGLLRTLEIIEQAVVLKIPIIIGAHVGETSLLTRASMVAARAAGCTLLAQEGGFGTHLLQHDICDVPLMFGEQGEIRISDRLLKSAGFGLSIT